MKRISMPALIILLVTLLGGCAGGGTQGTGGIVVQGARLLGRVVDTNGHPLASVTITSLSNGDSTSTDTAGKYDLLVELMQNSKKVNLEFVKGSAVSHLDLNIPESSSGKFLLNVVFDTNRETVTKTEFRPE